MCDMYLKDSRFIEDMEKTVVPKLSKIKESGYYGTNDGKRLYYEKFINENERAVVVISHGFCEFAEKFEEVIYYFLCKGYSVYIPEHRGHGKSDRDVDDLSKVYVKSFDEYVSDFAGFVNDIVKKETEKDKKIILYAPTFRGNIYQGFSMLPFDGEKLINSFDENTYLIYKLHPLLKNICLPQHPRIIDMFNEDTHELFALSDLLISDFSSIVFDYSILNKTMYFYVPDLNDYLKDVGCYVNIDLFPGKICKNIDELIQGIQKNEVGNLEAFKNIFFEYQDGKNTKRVVELIYDILKKSL